MRDTLAPGVAADEAGGVPAATAAESAPPASSRGGWVAGVAEIVVALVVAAAMVLASATVDVNPLDRVGQVSGLAGLGLRFALLGLLLLAAVVLVSRPRAGRWRDLAVRLGCAGTAGLGSGLVAGGVVVIMNGTSMPINATHGDIRVLAGWAASIMEGQSTMPGNYPPAFSTLLAWYSSLTGTEPMLAVKDFQIVGTALLLPAAYLAWRLLFRPLPALAVGLVSAVPLLYPYKPYEPLVLVVLVPVLAKAVQYLATTPNRGARQVLLVGAAFGAGLGLLFLIYSGYFLWALPGVLVAVLILFPWRRGALRGLLFGAAAVVVFLAVSAVHLVPLVLDWTKEGVRDTYFYFDAFVDPAYIAMWRTDFPGEVGAWPPHGEFGGVGVFTLLLVVGLGVAIALGHRDAIVLTASLGFAGAWLMRLYYAGQMYGAQDVRLWPRSSAFILYCLVVLVMMAGYLAVRRWRSSAAAGRSAQPARPVRGVPAAALGALAAVLFLLASSGSAYVDKFMPRRDNSEGALAWNGHVARMPDGRCSVHLMPDCQTVRHVKPERKPANVPE
ncbi:galactan 5-O-arabinofuranosyltransferase [Amycolatopsis arida]|uniref:Galactan 5-O-arabinofuranosyltransferase n=1 Tax=Amycolatopsis arida TaxID=587909 RepID=A0A1I5YJY8_9PSEU|nr:hypothetical protein [Amycolatopsis arida]TDX90571.1 galactan 5-O-arabinofuranosyltransferase [Amycolatopsis arida]SFQ44508.1 galactan 5-O-arabinofuranosyltransferase [Amycolatopsis arida]